MVQIIRIFDDDAIHLSPATGVNTGIILFYNGKDHIIVSCIQVMRMPVPITAAQMNLDITGQHHFSDSNAGIKKIRTRIPV